MRCAGTLALAGVWVFFAQAASAQEPVVLWDTFAFDGPTSKNRIIGCQPIIGDPCDDVLTDSDQWADWFQVSGGDHTLDAVTLRLGSSSGNLVVRLWDDAAGIPGTVLEQLLIPGPFNTPPAFRDLATPSVTEPLLEDGGIYWISVAMEAPLGIASWRMADLANPPPAPLVSDELVFARTNGEPTRWFLNPPDTGDIDGDGDQDPLPGAYYGVMRVTGIPVPEPASLLAHGAALAATALLAPASRRRTRGAAAGRGSPHGSLRESPPHV